jgi:hypothetical protein
MHVQESETATIAMTAVDIDSIKDDGDESTVDVDSIADAQSTQDDVDDSVEDDDGTGM